MNYFKIKMINDKIKFEYFKNKLRPYDISKKYNLQIEYIYDVIRFEKEKRKNKRSV